jgi:hypothetical protein
MVALLFKVICNVEHVSGEFRSYDVQNVISNHMAEQVWEYLKTESPELRRDEFQLDQSGPMHSGQRITATSVPKRVWQAVSFQVIHKRRIRYEKVEIWNMWRPEEIWNHFVQEDERILPLEAYEVEDRRS